ncbi:AraC family transcriptional regulator [Actinoplanes sp. NPDC024001]|uniref:helix-turn-helix transcriptional regulator n=1 Tax=Actinoplanes sp. NPDC024001 TaxID=3154598 RepID=UPI0033F31323
MQALIHVAHPATASLPPDWAGIGSCALPVAADAVTDLMQCHAVVHTVTVPLIAEIDFVRFTCEPGSLLWLRPGQAVRFETAEPAPAGDEVAKPDEPGPALTIVFRSGLFTADDLPGLSPDDPDGPARQPVMPPDPREFRAAFERLARDAGGTPGPATAALLRHELAAVLLRLALLDPGPALAGHVESRTFERFRRRLEEGYPHTRRVEDYAAELSCSVRTLTRASLAITGRTAKQVVDDRVALQARRLLAATPLSVAEVGRSLGFGEPTNFGRFFHRETGLSPGQFRARFTTDRPSGIPGQRSPAD